VGDRTDRQSAVLAVQGAGFGEVSVDLAAAMLPEEFPASEYLCSMPQAKREA